MNILFATSNPHKVTEVAAILATEGITINSLAELETVPPEPVEDEETFEGNARLKAVAYARATGCRCLADDSGLEVDCLDGEPGVHSARWAGVEGDRATRDAANNAKLIRALAERPDATRAARFVCTMCIADPDGSIVAESRGTFEGEITPTPAGGNGFGYDPLSHRGAATRALLDALA